MNVVAPTFHGFLSYAQSDADVASRVWEALERRGLPIWRDVVDGQPGEPLPRQLADAVRANPPLLAIVTESWLSRPWTSAELQVALMQRPGSGVVPLLAGRDVRLPPELAPLLGVPLRPDLDDFESDMDAVAAVLKGERAGAARRLRAPLPLGTPPRGGLLPTLRGTLGALTGRRDAERYQAEVARMSMLRHDIMATLTSARMNLIAALEDDLMERGYVQASLNEIEVLYFVLERHRIIEEIETGLAPNRERGRLLGAIREACDVGWWRSDRPRVVVDVPPHLQDVPIDARLLTHAVRELVSNAYRFGGDGDQPAITVRRTQPPFVDISVSGGRTPILPEEVPHLREFGFRGRGALHVSASGQGVGLFIAQAVAEAHGGQLSFAVGDGTPHEVVLRVHPWNP